MIEEKKKETKAAAAASADYPQQYHRHNNFYTNPNGNPIPNTNPSSNQYYPKPDKPSFGSGSSKQWKNGGSMDEDDDPYRAVQLFDIKCNKDRGRLTNSEYPFIIFMWLFIEHF